MIRTLVAALVTLGDPGTLSGGYLYHRRLAELAAEQDARLVFVSVPERPWPLAIVDAPSVLRAARRRAAHVLVLDSIAAAFLGPWLTLFGASLPMVGMLHQPPGGIDYTPPRSTLQAALDRLAYRRARRLLVASDHLAAQLRQTTSRPRHVFVLPPGRDVAAVPAAPPSDVRHGRRAAFLSVGNWVERKGLLSLLDAFARLDPGAATLHLVGDTRSEPRFAERVQARLARPDLTERVVVHGPLSINEVAALYGACDAFVLPSLKEPYGTVYGEAMAYGLPVVGWRAGNLPYLADHEREGLLVRIGDVERLADALRRLADDPHLRRRLGDNARRRAELRPTWRDVAQRFFEHLREVFLESQINRVGGERFR
ncbi:MAG TPA: glycosyltransferase family 4 protein [Chloroflexota bacterium]|jgi:glycosyltransferase involved in cell wall biosynthesis|nr:glycosyltransferase family 4 protein [Chloroflexota bacterium]